MGKWFSDLKIKSYQTNLNTYNAVVANLLGCWPPLPGAVADLAGGHQLGWPGLLYRAQLEAVPVATITQSGSRQSLQYCP
jgi:hypothetical protein